LRVKNQKAQFIDGTNWLTVAVSLDIGYALQKDGSLWEITDGAKPFLSGSCWRDIVCRNREFAALKADGTIWSWGYRWRKQQGYTEIRPWQASPDTNWIAVAASRWSILGEKSDGTFWIRGEIPTPNSTSNVVAENFQLWLKPTGQTFASISLDWGAFYAVATDHTLWKRDRAELRRLGSDADWSDIAVIFQQTLAALKTNGSFWLIRSDETGHFEQTCLSDYDVWQGIAAGGPIDDPSGGYWSILALSNDGMLTRWRAPYPDSGWGHYVNPSNLMAPSRRKAFTVAQLDPSSN